MATVSNDLLWSLTKTNNAYLVKRAGNGGMEISRDPLNPSGKNTRSSSGLVQDKAIGVVKCPKSGKITMVTRNSATLNKPANSLSVTSFKKHVSGRRIAKAVSNTAQNIGRPDMQKPAVVKASTLARADNKPGRTFEKTSRK